MYTDHLINVFMFNVVKPYFYSLKYTVVVYSKCLMLLLLLLVVGSELILLSLTAFFPQFVFHW